MSAQRAFLLAAAGHLLLLGLLSLEWARRAPPLPSPPGATLVDLVELSAAAPQPAEIAALPPPPSAPAPPAEPELPLPSEAPLAPPAEEPEGPDVLRPAEDRSAQEALAEMPPAPPRPARPRAAPRQPETGFDPRAIERLLEEVPAPRRAPAPAGAASAAAQRTDPRTVAGLEQAIRAQIAPCWNPPVGGADVAGMTAVLRIRLNRDGTIAAPPELVSQTGATPGNAAYARAFVESARRAVLRCTPLALPPDLYAWWRDFELNFDPRLMT